MRALSITALLLATASPALAEPSVEVMHFWTSGGEAAALGTVRDKLVTEGVTWTDAPVAGGGGDQAKTALQARIASGNPPAAVLMLGQTITDWAAEGMLGNVDALAEAQAWDAALPQAVKDFTQVEGHWVSVPTNVHRTDMIWASRAAFDAIGADIPTTWEELNALAPRFVEAGIIPLAHGGQALSAEQVAANAAAGDVACRATLTRHASRLARALAGVINLLDPDVIVLGGGLSRMAHLYEQVPALWSQWVFSGGLRDPVRTRLLPSLHGDASGVRGAAWLWRDGT